MVKGRKRNKIDFARSLRKDQTKIEEVLWWLLRKRRMFGYKFRRQYIVNGFILDFYCPSIKLGIEIDGKIHLKQRDYDKARQRVIEEKGIKLIRFTNDDVINNPGGVLTSINKYLPIMPSPLRGEGGPEQSEGG